MTASTALTIVSVNAISTVTIKPFTDSVKIAPARTPGELIERIRYASASIADISLFLRRLGSKLDKTDLRVVEYALARAYYREMRPMTVRQIAVASRQTTKQILNHMKWLGIQARDVLTNDEASRVFSRLMEEEMC